MNTLYWSKNRVETLKARKRRCVCKYCGNSLVVKRILFSDIEDARIELYCENCERIEYGVEPEIYQSASNFVDNLEVDFFENLDDNEKKRQMNIAKVAEIMAWGFRNTGLLSVDGFTVPLHMKRGAWEECIILENDEVPSEDVLKE
ncbi:MAG: hypothetical protein UDB11_06600 [Peptococcaceae bacterium]|nr:hypothetical protein [Peptococcaceae bacterium]